MQLRRCVLPLLFVLGLSVTLAVNPSANIDLTEVDDLNDEHGFVSVYKNYPKIQVTVDTSKLKRVSQPESKSDDESTSSGSSGSSGSESVERPTVGVRTDITIEISEETANETKPGDGAESDGKNGDSGKKSKKSDRPDDDNASIPVFKGTAGVTSKPKPTERPPHASRPPFTPGHRPTTYFHRPDDQNRVSGEFDSWNQYHPVTAVWTTERPYIRRVDYDYSAHHPTHFKGYIPYNLGQHPDVGSDWKPCYCSVYQPWPRAPTNPVLPTPRKKVDDKVDAPFAQYRPRS